ncbi:MAG: class I SAM-dependent methyltransferase [Geobacteraceae bacterium]|nr:class I SAM-dependent methyltransferase [Geobacteraceae bacterium]
MPISTNHYNRTGLTEAILTALTSSGKDLSSITTHDLAPIDELHVRGRKATMELAGKLPLQPGLRVLDIGSGLGGAARYLAGTSGCNVTGIDLTYDYCHGAKRLGELTSLEGRTTFVQGDATTLPFPDSCFDMVWTIHTAMNIPDKAGLYREISRVLKPGGTLALYDILKGEGGEIHTPVPWAMTAQQSHLATPAELTALLEGSGFSITLWNDLTDEGRIWFKHLAERTASGTPHPLGVHLLFGSDFPQMARNQVRNLEENRIVLLECLATRQG